MALLAAACLRVSLLGWVIVCVVRLKLAIKCLQTPEFQQHQASIFTSIVTNDLSDIRRAQRQQGEADSQLADFLETFPRLLDTGATIESLPEADCTESFLTEQARHGCASTRPAPWAALFGSTGCHHLPPSDAHCSHDKVSELPARSLCQRFAAQSIQEGTHRIKTHRTNIII